ncbi:MAG TPA: 2-oxoacid:acceptor oxidoreductase family protein [Chthonomonadales bacterium]|nr:2-oxoacid:acceptor oxidoreductase family protein [Chthonomonadales bacterium]
MHTLAADALDPEPDLVVHIAGEPGEGVVTLGELAVRPLASLGFQVCTSHSFAAEVRGGAVMCQLRIAAEPPLTHGYEADIVLAIGADGLERSGEGLAPNALVLLDEGAAADNPSFLMAPHGRCMAFAGARCWWPQECALRLRAPT